MIITQIRRCIDAGVIEGDAKDLAHVVIAPQGLAAQEAEGWLGATEAAINGRWDLAFNALLDGVRPDASSTARARPKQST